MLDPRFPEDTLFLCFEQDFRWYERDCLSLEEWLPLAIQKQKGKEDAGGGAARPPHVSSGSASSDAWVRRDEQNQEQHLGATHGVQQQAKAEGPASISREVFELVASCNLAHREGYGELIWFGYNVSNKKHSSKKGFVGYGSQGVAFTRQAARTLQEVMKWKRPELFDMFLKGEMVEDFTPWPKQWKSALAKSSFIHPPLGGFYEHDTEILGPGKSRPSLFGADWGQEGSVGAVRPTDTSRELKKWTPGGSWEEEGETVTKLPPVFHSVNNQLYWKTMAPPLSWQRGESTFDTVLSKMGYLGPQDEYWGPPYKEGEGWRQLRRSGGAWEWHEEPSLKTLREHPDGSPTPQPPNVTFLSRLGMQVAAYDPENPPTTKRDQRRFRERQTLHGYRVFVPFRASLQDFGMGSD